MRTFLSDPARYGYVWATAVIIVVLRGLFLVVMDVDASQYASISMEMLQNGQWLEVQHRQQDYLDKPPLLFWLSAAALSIFGGSTWAYKLPSVLAAVLGVLAVYRFCLLFYLRETAARAAFMLATSVGFFLLCQDVRTDTLLMGTSAAAVWQLAAFGQKNNKKHLIWAGFLVGLAMLAKGPIGLIVPMAAVGGHLLLTGNTKGIFRWEWLLALPIIALLLLPMCYGLYQQFDLHPDKLINGRTGVSGLYFYFWEQSFGRITGENVWQNDTTPLFFLHVMAWAFLPWALWLPVAIWQKCAQRLKNAHGEYYALSALVLVFVALSLSRYKLPHYIFVVLPWAAIVVASGWERMGQLTVLRWLNWAVLALVAVALSLLLGVVFQPVTLFLWPILGIGAITALYWAWPPRHDVRQVFSANVLMGILVGVVLHFHFYPNLLPYQSTSVAGAWLKANGIPVHQTACAGHSGHALDFYAGYNVPFLADPKEAQTLHQQNGPLYIYIREGGSELLDAAGIRYEVVLPLQHYQPALLSIPFLNPGTRERTLTEAAIVRTIKSTSQPK